MHSPIYLTFSSLWSSLLTILFLLLLSFLVFFIGLIIVGCIVDIQPEHESIRDWDNAPVPVGKSLLVHKEPKVRKRKLHVGARKESTEEVDEEEKKARLVRYKRKYQEGTKSQLAWVPSNKYGPAVKIKKEPQSGDSDDEENEETEEEEEKEGEEEEGEGEEEGEETDDSERQTTQDEDSGQSYPVHQTDGTFDVTSSGSTRSTRLQKRGAIGHRLGEFQGENMVRRSPRLSEKGERESPLDGTGSSNPSLATALLSRFPLPPTPSTLSIQSPPRSPTPAFGTRLKHSRASQSSRQSSGLSQTSACGSETQEEATAQLQVDLTTTSNTIRLNPPPHHASTNRNIIHLGDHVLRRRPSHTILKGTADELDPWDGPFKVLDIYHTKDNGTSGPEIKVKLSFPPQSSLRKSHPAPGPHIARTPSPLSSKEWYPIDHLQKYIPGPQNPLVSFEPAIHPRTGEAIFEISKIRGKRVVQIVSNSKGSKKRTGTRVAREETQYLIQWKGYPSEDCTWEEPKRSAVPRAFLKDWERRAREWENEVEKSGITRE